MPYLDNLGERRAAHIQECHHLLMDQLFRGPTQKLVPLPGTVLRLCAGLGLRGFLRLSFFASVKIIGTQVYVKHQAIESAPGLTTHFRTPVPLLPARVRRWTTACSFEACFLTLLILKHKVAVLELEMAGWLKSTYCSNQRTCVPVPAPTPTVVLKCLQLHL